MIMRLAWMGALLALCGVAQAAWHWGFDTDNEGWVVADLTTGGPYHPPMATYSVSHSNSGGCLGGHIYRHDPSNRTFSFSLPVEQLPEGQDWAGGRLDFCLRCTHQTWTEEPYVVFVGGDGTELRATVPLPGTEWSTCRVDLLPENLLDADGQAPDEVEFQAVMQQLEAVYIIAEYGSQVQETSGLDEVRVPWRWTSLGCRPWWPAARKRRQWNCSGRRCRAPGATPCGARRKDPGRWWGRPPAPAGAWLPALARRPSSGCGPSATEWVETPPDLASPGPKAGP